jgi:hypothetical protein
MHQCMKYRYFHLFPTLKCFYEISQAPMTGISHLLTDDCYTKSISPCGHVTKPTVLTGPAGFRDTTFTVC